MLCNLQAGEKHSSAWSPQTTRTNTHFFPVCSEINENVTNQKLFAEIHVACWDLWTKFTRTLRLSEMFATRYLSACWWKTRVHGQDANNLQQKQMNSIADKSNSVGVRIFFLFFKQSPRTDRACMHEGLHGARVGQKQTNACMHDRKLNIAWQQNSVFFGRLFQRIRREGGGLHLSGSL